MNKCQLSNVYKNVKKDFIYFATNFLKIRTKEHSIDNFILNREQKYINKLLLEQKKRTGKIKALILKGRQVGVTTLFVGINFHFSLTNKGVKSLVLTHRQSATNNIYSIIYRFYNNIPFFLNYLLAFTKIQSFILKT